MLVLDSNVISELMRPAPEAAVIAWLDRQPAQSVWTASICVFEICMGLALLPGGKKRRELERLFRLVLREDLAGRVLDFDSNAAYAATEIAGKIRPLGKSMDMRDLLIAGTVAARRATLATRNTAHFINTGISLVNPWELDPSDPSHR